MPLETSALPVSVELIVDDPTVAALPRERIHLGYDARATRAPRLFRSLITLAEEPNGDPRVRLENQASYGLSNPEALTVVGGLFDGESLDRSDPLGGRLTYTPMPPMSHIDLGIGERYRVGLGASTPVALDAEVEMVTGANEKRATAHLAPLPTSLEASYVPGATADQRTVTITSAATVGDVDLGYRETEGGTPLLGAVLHASDLPTEVTVEQTAERAGSVETNGAFGSVEFGLADGDPVLGTADGPYVNLVDDGTHSSVAARIDGLRRASVDATDAIVADIEVTPAGRKPVVVDVQRPGLVVAGEVANLPEHLSLVADLDGPTVTYDGFGHGLDHVTIEADADAPLFARATHLRAHATNLPPAFELAVRKRHLETDAGVVLLDGVEVTSTAPIGTVEFEADDGEASVLPAARGATYLDTPARFAVAARVDGFERVSMLNRIGGWTELGTTLGAGPFHVKVQTNDPTVPNDALLVEGDVLDLPHVLDARVRPPSETHDGRLELEASDGIDAIDLRVEPQAPLLERDGADPDIAIVALEGVPADLDRRRGDGRLGCGSHPRPRHRPGRRHADQRTARLDRRRRRGRRRLPARAPRPVHGARAAARRRRPQLRGRPAPGRGGDVRGPAVRDRRTARRPDGLGAAGNDHRCHRRPADQPHLLRGRRRLPVGGAGPDRVAHPGRDQPARRVAQRRRRPLRRHRDRPDPGELPDPRRWRHDRRRGAGWWLDRTDRRPGLGRAARAGGQRGRRQRVPGGRR